MAQEQYFIEDGSVFPDQVQKVLRSDPVREDIANRAPNALVQRTRNLHNRVNDVQSSFNAIMEGATSDGNTFAKVRGLIQGIQDWKGALTAEDTDNIINTLLDFAKALSGIGEGPQAVLNLINNKEPKIGDKGSAFNKNFGHGEYDLTRAIETLSFKGGIHNDQWLSSVWQKNGYFAIYNWTTNRQNFGLMSYDFPEGIGYERSRLNGVDTHRLLNIWAGNRTTQVVFGTEGIAVRQTPHDTNEDGTKLGAWKVYKPADTQPAVGKIVAMGVVNSDGTIGRRSSSSIYVEKKPRTLGEYTVIHSLNILPEQCEVFVTPVAELFGHVDTMVKAWHVSSQQFTVESFNAAKAPINAKFAFQLVRYV